MQAFCTELAHAHVSLKAIFEAHNFFEVIKTLRLEERNRNAMNQLILKASESFAEQMSSKRNSSCITKETSGSLWASIAISSQAEMTELRTFKYVIVPLKLNHKSTNFFTESKDPGNIRTSEGKNQQDDEKGKSNLKLSLPTLNVL